MNNRVILSIIIALSTLVLAGCTAGKPTSSSIGGSSSNKGLPFAITGITGGSDTITDAYYQLTTSPTVNWNSLADAVGYEVIIRDNLNVATISGCGPSIVVAPATSYSFSAGCVFATGTTYMANVTATDKNGKITSATPFSFMVDTAAPTGLSVSLASFVGGSFTLGWTPASDSESGMASYKIEMMTGGCGGTAVMTGTASAGASSYPITGLSDGQSVMAKVTAYDNAGRTFSSCSSAATVDAAGPTMSSFTLPASNIFSTSSTYVFSWSGSSPTDGSGSGLTGSPYQIITYSLGGCAGTGVSQGTQSGMSYNYTGLSSGSVYSIAITLIDLVGNTTTYCSPNVSVDTQVPSLSSISISPATTPNNSSSQTVSGSCADLGGSNIATAGVKLCTKLSGSCSTPDFTTTANCTAGSFSYSLSLSQGTYDIQVKALDNAGNTSTPVSINSNYQIDTTIPAAFSISGIDGSPDVIQDAWLTASVDPTIHWSSSAGASTYDVVIKDAADTTNITSCSVTGVGGLATTLSGCGSNLTNGTNYNVHVTAKSFSGLNSTAAAVFPFTTDRVAPGGFSISGIRGGSDVTTDAYMTSGSNPTVYWSGSTNAASYSIVIKNAADSITKCSTTSGSSPASLTGCALSNGNIYHAHVTAMSASGTYSTNASNDASYTFLVDTAAPGAFFIDGVGGGTDFNTFDTFLTSFTTAPDIEFDPASGASTYDIVIKDSADTNTVCSITGTASSPTSMSACGGLISGQTFHVHMTARSPSGFNTTTASNDSSFTFTVTGNWNSVSSSGITGRYGHSAVWTGSKMIVWGGNASGSGVSDGAMYDPGGNSWSTISAGLPNSPSGRFYHTSIWTGTKMITWGGQYGVSAATGNGAWFDPVGVSWTTLSSAPVGNRYNHTAIWTGSKMIVWGGQSNSTTYFANGAMYDPSSDTWTTMAGSPPSARGEHVAIWTGSKMIVWGGHNNGTDFNDGGIFDPVGNTWSALATSGALSARTNTSAIFDGLKMIIWGGFYSPGPIYYNNGATLDPSVNTFWNSTAMTGATPANRKFNTMTSTPMGAVVWGGTYSGGALDDGAIYDSSIDVWSPMGTDNVPSPRFKHTSVWTGSEVLTWGGWDGTTYFSSGRRYLP